MPLALAASKCTSIVQVTQLEQNMNVLVGIMFLVQVLISVLCALGQNNFNTMYLRDMWYLTAPM